MADRAYPPFFSKLAERAGLSPDQLFHVYASNAYFDRSPRKQKDGSYKTPDEPKPTDVYALAQRIFDINSNYEIDPLKPGLVQGYYKGGRWGPPITSLTAVYAMMRMNPQIDMWQLTPRYNDDGTIFSVTASCNVRNKGTASFECVAREWNTNTDQWRNMPQHMAGVRALKRLWEIVDPLMATPDAEEMEWMETIGAIPPPADPAPPVNAVAAATREQRKQSAAAASTPAPALQAPPDPAVPNQAAATTKTTNVAADPTPPAKQPESVTPPAATGAPRAEVTIDEAVAQGVADHEVGKRLLDNPYKRGTPQAIGWDRGWNKSESAKNNQAAVAQKSKPAEVQAPAAAAPEPVAPPKVDDEPLFDDAGSDPADFVGSGEPSQPEPQQQAVDALEEREAVLRGIRVQILKVAPPVRRRAAETFVAAAMRQHALGVDETMQKYFGWKKGEKFIYAPNVGWYFSAADANGRMQRENMLVDRLAELAYDHNDIWCQAGSAESVLPLRAFIGRRP